MHVIGPQLGITQPGMTIVCGDSHTATHGAFGALAFGIGTSEVEHVLATQTLPQARPQDDGGHRRRRAARPGVTAKDLVLALIAQVGTGGGVGHVVEYRGPAIEALSMEGRMTISNMSIEWGAKAGLIAPDETTFAYLKGRPYAPKGDDWDARAGVLARACAPTTDAVFDTEVVARRERASRRSSPGAPTRARARRWTASCRTRPTSPTPASAPRPSGRWTTWTCTPGTPLRDVAVDVVFLGSCTNGRLEDLRAAADVLRGRQVADGVRMLVVPGSAEVRAAAEAEGLDEVFTDAGAEWRFAGCSMCLGMNPDTLKPGQRSASTSNRNFEGRQGRGGRTHLVSPPVAAATAVVGRLAAPADL